MSRSRKLTISALVAFVALAAAVWFFFFRDTSPPAPTLEGAVSGVTSTEPGGSATSETTVAGIPIEGDWSLSADGTSYVGYRVQEELASVGAKSAVGRTPLVAATLTIEGDRVSSVVIDADLTGLQSDAPHRDRALRGQALETDAFPNAGFTLTAPITLPAGTAAGEPIQVTASGELTLHGVTRPVDVPLEAQLVDGRIVVVGSLPVLFADYGIDKPSAMGVLSVDDHGLMELLLVFEPVG